MRHEIGKLDKARRTVPVFFEHNGVTHTRDVNACYDAKGKYDDDATVARVQEVAAGVERKIELGVIVADPTPSAS
ncbi:hypothetical protein [Asticcacaulis solisilvae]|uniref:hypothetical protein n=1 Tax=Asticcacaulis solisilvae TaxID=1217274 RepID=UPI003FD81106